MKIKDRRIVKVSAYPNLLQVPLPNNNCLITYSCNWAVKHNNKTIIRQRDLYKLHYAEWVQTLKQDLEDLNIKEPRDIYIEIKRVVVTYANNYKVQLTHHSITRKMEQSYIETSNKDYIDIHKLEDLKQWI